MQLVGNKPQGIGSQCMLGGSSCARDLQVSALVGEARMWQLAGDMPDKERGYLAERLKYSAREPQSSPAVCWAGCAPKPTPPLACVASAHKRLKSAC
jgi:hypothetical protein